MVASVPAEVRPAICPKCGKEWVDLQPKCASCGEYRDWRRWIKPGAAVVTFLVATTAGVLGIRGTLAAQRLQSRTRVLSLGHTSDATLLMVVVANEGKGKSSVVRKARAAAGTVQPEVTLVPAQPNIIEFGVLTLVSEDAKKVIQAGQSTEFQFDISHIRPVDDDDFWTRHGMMMVTLTGLEVVESNGKVHPLNISEPLIVLKRFVQLRSDPREVHP